jgi:CheY-like chemotaxis protein
VSDVLVVDDDRDIREAVEEILVDEGYEVTTAKNGREALDVLAHSAPPAVILLDMAMPVMDGAAFCAVRNADERLSAIPVIAFSAVAALRERVSRLAVDGVLEKPLTVEALLGSVRRFAPGRA